MRWGQVSDKSVPDKRLLELANKRPPSSTLVPSRMLWQSVGGAGRDRILARGPSGGAMRSDPWIVQIGDQARASWLEALNQGVWKGDHHHHTSAAARSD